MFHWNSWWEGLWFPEELDKTTSSSKGRKKEGEKERERIDGAKGKRVEKRKESSFETNLPNYLQYWWDNISPFLYFLFSLLLMIQQVNQMK